MLKRVVTASIMNNSSSLGVTDSFVQLITPLLARFFMSINTPNGVSNRREREMICCPLPCRLLRVRNLRKKILDADDRYPPIAGLLLGFGAGAGGRTVAMLGRVSVPHAFPFH
jgi:hypothetical protein